jgi:exodeoxyribonuclease III
MRLVTWNVNSLRQRLPRVLELLHELAPDVLCLQETKLASDAFPHDELAMVGYRAAAHGEGRWNGVAVLTREGAEVADVVAGLRGEPTVTEARWIEVTVDGTRIVSVYVPNGRAPGDPMFQVKLDFLDAMRTRVGELLRSGPLLVAGDMNVAPEDRDVWDPAVFVGSTHVTPAERQRLAAVQQLGLTDAFRAIHADRDGFTFWDYRAGAFRRNLGMRIDLVLASDHLTVRSCEVARAYRRVGEAGDKPSDHAPLVAELDR